VRELQPGLWHWEAPHPDWKPGEGWDEVVSSYAIEDGERLVAGDTLVDRGNGLELSVDWLPEGETREHALAALRPLLELPVELVLPTHGAPADRAALERALS
jgi:glyoxylase-like metal-dependent hydrolase (beta-lactamase superfamily II)